MRFCHLANAVNGELIFVNPDAVKVVAATLMGGKTVTAITFGPEHTIYVSNALDEVLMDLERASNG